MLCVNPNDRPNISDVLDRLQEVAAARNISLKTPLNIVDRTTIPQFTGKEGIYMYLFYIGFDSFICTVYTNSQCCFKKLLIYINIVDLAEGA